jgi:hypothetical protein
MCYKCDNIIPKNKSSRIKTIKKCGDQYKEVNFCDTKCLEKTSFNIKKDKIKGGRKKQSDK